MLTNIINGKFGKKQLKSKYRVMWMRFLLTSSVVLLAVLFGVLYAVWGEVTNFLNYVIWGIH